MSYHCANEYELIGRAEKICLADGSWMPKESPQCVQVRDTNVRSSLINPYHLKNIVKSSLKEFCEFGLAKKER